MNTLLTLFVCCSIQLITCNEVQNKSKTFRNVNKRALQISHEKSQLEKWEDKFLNKNLNFDQTGSLVVLLNKIAMEYLTDCTPIILYDEFTESDGDLLLQQLFKIFPIPYVHGQITDDYQVKAIHKRILLNTNTCSSYILFMKDVMRCKDVIGAQSNAKVIVISRSSQWRVYEFLSNDVSQNFLNLLVVAKSEKIQSARQELPYILFTHQLYIDALGSSTHQVLTSWWNGKLTRPNIHLFPKKITDGFAGHRFIISAAHQPPFVIKREKNDNDDVQWDGIEVRLVELLSRMYNFSTDYKEAKESEILGSPEAVTKSILNKKGNLGIAGLYITDKRMQLLDNSVLHSQDCVSFISLTSTALPRYRAIMGPFHWSVWLALTFIYLFAIFPISFSDKHTLKPLLKNPEEIENMFWYVFGTFTNCFSFVGKKSWSGSDKIATRLFIGFYWIFTIIITACYTGSIIAFVTLPTFPATIDSAEQLLNGRYQVGTLDKGGWEYWFENSSDPITTKLLKNIDLVPDIESGLKNTTKAFFWPYAFMGSRAQLDYIVRTNFTTKNKRALLHISANCFVPFGVGLIYNKNSLYTKVLDIGILKIVQAGFMEKMKHDVEWLMMRSATGKLLAANSMITGMMGLKVEDRALTLDDTQGMFLLLGIGFVLGGASLLSEWLGGCYLFCRRIRRNKSGKSIKSNKRSHDIPTPRQKLDSIQYENSVLETAEDNEESKQIGNEVVRENDKEKFDLETEIDKLFDFGAYFGEKTDKDEHVKQSSEELITNN